MSSRSPSAWRFLLFVLFAYWLLAFVLTHLPGSVVHRVGRGLSFSVAHADKVAHCILYAGLSFLLMWFLVHMGRAKRTAGILTFTVALAYGLVDEWLQHYIPRRSTDLMDWFADAIGSGLGIFLFCLASSVLSRWTATRADVVYFRR